MEMVLFEWMKLQTYSSLKHIKTSMPNQLMVTLEMSVLIWVTALQEVLDPWKKFDSHIILLIIARGP